MECFFFSVVTLVDLIELFTLVIMTKRQNAKLCKNPHKIGSVQCQNKRGRERATMSHIKHHSTPDTRHTNRQKKTTKIRIERRGQAARNSIYSHLLTMSKLVICAGSCRNDSNKLKFILNLPFSQLHSQIVNNALV